MVPLPSVITTTGAATTIPSQRLRAGTGVRKKCGIFSPVCGGKDGDGDDEDATQLHDGDAYVFWRKDVIHRRMEFVRACVCVCACVHVCVCDGVLKGKKADSSQIRPLQLRRRKKPRQPSYPLALISTKGKNNKQKVTADNLQHRLEETPYTYFVQAPAGPLPEVG